MPADSAVYSTGRGACLCRLRFAPTSHIFLAPIPRPALAERSSHAGEGGDFRFILPGASPPAPLRLRREVCWLTGGLRCRKPPGTQYRSRHEFGDTATARKNNAARVLPRGCKGRSPLHKKALVLPLPQRGKSALRARVGGMGAKDLTGGRIKPTTPGQTPKLIGTAGRTDAAGGQVSAGVQKPIIVL